MNSERLSVILATLNRADLLDRELESFSRLDVDGIEVEFIIVDNGSQDRTGEVIESWARVLPIVSWTVARPGKNRCLNQAVRRAKGELLVFTDDDVIADSKWLQAFMQAARRWPKEKIFGGTITPSFPGPVPGYVRALHRYFGPLYSVYQPSSDEGYVEVPPFGPNLMLRREIFEKNCYDESIGPTTSGYAMGSETELLVRLQQQGMQFVFVPTAQVQHTIRLEQFDQQWLLERAFRSGRGKARLDQSHRAGSSGRAPWFLPVKRHWRVFASKANRLVGRSDAAFSDLWKAKRAEGALFEYRNHRLSN
jgi:glucosyl-dolichyl phosphate glucuronosyltransferase